MTCTRVLPLPRSVKVTVPESPELFCALRVTEVVAAAGAFGAVVAISLVAAVLLTQHFPIHVHQNSKIHMGSVPLYLMATLLPPPLAALAAFVGQGTGELMMRKAREGTYGDVLTQIGRLSFTVTAASLLAHSGGSEVALFGLPLVGAAAVMWLGDMLTTPLLIGPITGESPSTIVRNVVRGAGAMEAAQYLVGMLGAVAGHYQLWTLVLISLPTAMIYVTGKRARELHDNTRQILESMADAVDLRDPYTGGHSRRVTEYTRGILRELGLQGPDVDLIVAAARVHDIGKIAMPDRVLLKGGKLTDEEWAVMRAHPEQGAEVLTRYPDFARGVEIVRHHHERWDGTGYPYGLRDTQIPFGARVIAVADSYDAMTSDRPYRRGMAPEQAASILREGRGSQWDGAIVDAFLRSIADRLAHPALPTLTLVPPPAEVGAAASA